MIFLSGEGPIPPVPPATEHKALYVAVARYLKPMRKVYPWIEHWDSGTCKSTQNLQCPDSYKCKSLRKKKCISDHGLELFIGEVTPASRTLPLLVSEAQRRRPIQKA